MSGNGALLAVRGVVQEFDVRGRGGVKAGVVHAVSGLSFDVAPGETLGVVGETGSGKSTLARAIALQADIPEDGAPEFRGGALDVLGVPVRGISARADTHGWSIITANDHGVCELTRSALHHQSDCIADAQL